MSSALARINGTMLVKHAVEAARGFGIGMLYLYTPGHEAFYRRLGWEFLEATHFCGRAITIMRGSPKSFRVRSRGIGWSHTTPVLK